MILCVLNREKICHQQLVHLATSSVYCSHFTLWNWRKLIFNSIIHTYRYFRLFTLSYLRYLLNHHTWRMSPCNMHNFFIWLKVCCIPPNVGGSEKAGWGLALVGLKRTGCDVWQMECQASNVTANVQSDHLLHGYMVPVFFTIDQPHRSPCSAKLVLDMR